MSATALAINLPGVTSLPRSIPKADRPIAETKLITPNEILLWANRPDFQRPLNINTDVIDAARAMMVEAAGDKDRMCTIVGTIEFGRFEGVDYLLDGQHRIFGAFALASGVKKLDGNAALATEGGVQPLVALADTKITAFYSMAEMGEYFVKLNKKLAPLKPDDLLRGREGNNPHLRAIREACPFIGYEKNRYTKETIMLSMSAAIRTWFGSGAVPAGGPNADRAAMLLNEDQAEAIIGFFKACEKAGWVNSQPGTERLWSSLNLGIHMWIWRKMVLNADSRGARGGYTALTPSQYAECMKDCLDPAYTKFLYSRSLRYQDRVPTYNYIQDLFLNGGLERCKIAGPKFPEPLGWES